MKRCGASSPWESTCRRPEIPAHADHLDEDGRVWDNPHVKLPHSRRDAGKPLTLARQIAARAKPVTTARFQPPRET